MLNIRFPLVVRMIILGLCFALLALGGHDAFAKVPAPPLLFCQAVLEGQDPRPFDAYFPKSKSGVVLSQKLNKPFAIEVNGGGADISSQVQTRLQFEQALKLTSADGMAFYQMVRRASQHLSALAVEHDIVLVNHSHNGLSMLLPEIVISPLRGHTELNVLAAQRWRDQNVVLKYSPYDLARLSSAAFFSALSRPILTSVGSLYIGSEVILTGSAQEKDLLHELVHANTFDLLRRNQDSGLHGAAKAKDPDYPGRLPLGPLVFPSEVANVSYPQYLAFDELAAWSITVERCLAQTQALLEQKQLSREAIQYLIKEIERARIIASQVVGISDGLRAIMDGVKLGANTATVITVTNPGRQSRFLAWRSIQKFEDDGKVYGIFKLRADPYKGNGDDETFEVKLPIIGSHGENDPRNTVALSAKIDQLSELAFESLHQFREVEILVQGLLR